MVSVERLEKNHMGQIVPGVWVGSLASLSHLDPRRNWTIITILSSNHMVKLACDIIAHSTVKIQEHVIWMLCDSVQADLLSENHLSRVFGILNKADTHNACLIHCVKGSSRSVSVCAAWLIASKRYDSLEKSLERIRRVRPNANPNLGFLASLRALEQCQGNVSKARERLTGVSAVESEEEVNG